MTINCKGTLIDLKSPKVMGILNLTPDSFYDGGRYGDLEHALEQTKKMLDEGATFIDVGAYSSRPGAKDVSVEEEERRLLPVVKELLIHFPDVLFSIDTFRASVARKAVEVGAALINDISAGKLDQDMMASVGSLGVPYIMMHMRGTPQTMSSFTQYTNVTKEVLYDFSERVQLAREAKINDLIIDPGFGFSKTINQNFTLLSQLNLLASLNLPILVGLSRKSMIYKTLGVEPQEALNGTTALHTKALLEGAHILRVHDVKEAVECIKLYKAIDDNT